MSTLTSSPSLKGNILNILHHGSMMIGCLFLAGLVGCKSNPSINNTPPTFTLINEDVSHQVVLKVAPPIRFFSTHATLERDTIKAQTKSIAERVATTAVKRAKLEIDGPLILVFEDLKSMATGPIAADIGFSVKGKATRLPGYSQVKKSEFKCISLLLKQSEDDHSNYWQKLYQLALDNGLKLNGESRTVISPVGTGHTTELQLGVL